VPQCPLHSERIIITITQKMGGLMLLLLMVVTILSLPQYLHSYQSVLHALPLTISYSVKKANILITLASSDSSVWNLEKLLNANTHPLNMGLWISLIIGVNIKSWLSQCCNGRIGEGATYLAITVPNDLWCIGIQWLTDLNCCAGGSYSIKLR
jgi:hypothetical protein